MGDGIRGLFQGVQQVFCQCFSLCFAFTSFLGFDGKRFKNSWWMIRATPSLACSGATHFSFRLRSLYASNAFSRDLLTPYGLYLNDPRFFPWVSWLSLSVACGLEVLTILTNLSMIEL
ncbi:hypothetical protein SISSUDRAFT_793166 [Sistotremastrum suecicum HHB10207 ss-3]|uniref:Uncharacterized protein n=1 Tax=Sistotremastrum suecicum HHB10207 ss-3 TaxID=1314776 RepID=A0A166HN34_9AGAM|nr:hypothetical protein SISSUDRAFT_793166 [Sistotremastrum suecicum HHB10207 ss-3]